MHKDNYQIVRATDAHAQELAWTMRKADVDEVYAAAGLSPLGALRSSLAVSPRPLAAITQNRVVAIYGVGEFPEDSGGCIWCLGADLLAQRKQSFVKEGLAFVARERKNYRTLGGYVDSRNENALRWVTLCGFKIESAKPYGFLRLPFHRFHMEGE